MNHIFRFFIFTGIVLFASCSNDPSEKKEISSETTENHTHPEVLPNLKLNNNQKWKVDESTSNSIVQMQQKVELYEVEKNKTLSGYVELGQKLQKDIDSLIQNCTMTGPNHEALHQWLHPFSEETLGLAKSTTNEEGHEYFEKIDAMLHKYYEYFE